MNADAKDLLTADVTDLPKKISIHSIVVSYSTGCSTYSCMGDSSGSIPCDGAFRFRIELSLCRMLGLIRALN